MVPIEGLYLCRRREFYSVGEGGRLVGNCTRVGEAGGVCTYENILA